MNKNIVLWSFLLFITILLLVQSCDITEDLVQNTFPNCKDLLVQADEETYIIEIKEDSKAQIYLDLTKKGNKEKLETIIQKELETILSPNPQTPIPVMDVVRKTCSCNLILMGVDKSINASDRSAEAKSKLKGQDNGTIKNIDNNYIFPVGPIDTLPRIERIPNSKIPVSQSTSKVIIANIDSGMDINHEQLQNNIWINPGEPNGSTSFSNANGLDEDNNCVVDDFVGYNFLHNNNNTKDHYGHGTHIAGIIAKDFYDVNASQNYPPDANFEDFKQAVSIMDLKILERDTASLFAAVCAIHYAIDKKAKVINASWGYYSLDTSPILKQAIERADKMGVFVVAAAGNHSQNIDKCTHWPASFSSSHKNVISVAALDGNKLADFSNYGKKNVNFATQGVNIESAFIYDNLRRELSGTSMAAPVVTRCIAWELFKGRSVGQIQGNLNNLSSNMQLNKPLRQNAELKAGPPYY